MKITPRAKQILVQPDPEKSRESESGLITPSNVEQEQKAIGTIIALGKGIEDLKKGERVIYGAYAGELITFQEKGKKVEYRILFDEDVLATIEY